MTRPQTGVALLLTLWALTLLSVMAITVSMLVRSHAQLAKQTAELARQRALADSGINYAVLCLLTQGPALVMYPDKALEWKYYGTRIAIAAQPEAGKVDLNAANEHLVAAILTMHGIREPDAIVTAHQLADWRSKESSDHQRRLSFYGRRKGPLETLDEMLQLFNVPRDIFERIRADVTVYSGLSEPNLLFASEKVRAAAKMNRASAIFVPSPQRMSVGTLSEEEQTALTIRSTAEVEGDGYLTRLAIVRVTTSPSFLQILRWGTELQKVDSGGAGALSENYLREPPKRVADPV